MLGKKYICPVKKTYALQKKWYGPLKKWYGPLKKLYGPLKKTVWSAKKTVCSAKKTVCTAKKTVWSARKTVWSAKKNGMVSKKNVAARKNRGIQHRRHFSALSQGHLLNNGFEVRSPFGLCPAFFKGIPGAWQERLRSAWCARDPEEPPVSDRKCKFSPLVPPQSDSCWYRHRTTRWWSATAP